jgi:hypothetical protein
MLHWIKRAGKLNSQLPQNHPSRRWEISVSASRKPLITREILNGSWIWAVFLAQGIRAVPKWCHLPWFATKSCTSEIPVATMGDWKLRAFLAYPECRRAVRLSLWLKKSVWHCSSCEKLAAEKRQFCGNWRILKFFFGNLKVSTAKFARWKNKISVVWYFPFS